MIMHFHFTAEDLIRTRMLSGASPLRETISSARMLRLGADLHGPYAAWALRTRRALSRPMQPFLELVPSPLGSLPNSLGRTETYLALPDALDTFQSTPRNRLQDDIDMLATA